MLIEIACFSLEAAIAAYEAGACRIELCASPAEGGLTPSAATMRLARKYIPIPIVAMVRPRSGDFCYTKREFESMLLDIVAAQIAKMDGVVLGCLNHNGTVDEGRTQMLVEAASGMEVVFHRAFDMSVDLEQSLETVIRTGCTRVLTSGGKPTAEEGAEMIAKLIKQADKRIQLLPGSGINPKNIKNLAQITGADQMHLSARSLVKGKMQFQKTGVTMGGQAFVPDYELLLPDAETIKNVLLQFDDKG